MARILTGDSMIKSVRQRTMTPDDTSTFTDDSVLDIIDEELSAQVLDKLLLLHGENLTISVDVPVNQEGEYEIPYRAVGNKLRDISLISGSSIYELSQVSIGELSDYSYGESSSQNLDKFYLENNKVKLIKPARTHSTVRIRYYLRPNYLTKMNEAGVIESIDTTTPGIVEFRLSSVGKNFGQQLKYDVIGSKSPNKIKSFDATAIAYTKVGDTGTLTFDSGDLGTVLDTISAGDYISLAEETPVPNIPTEMHPLLAQASAINILESLNDTEALTNATRRMEKMVKAIQNLIDDRVELAPKKIKQRHGTLSSVLGFGRRRGNR